jgi:amidase
MTDVLDGHDATGLAELARRGDVKPAELVEAAIARIEAGNPALNAVIHPRFELAMAEAAGPLPDGPFRGVPFLVKDILCTTAGDPYHEGTTFLRDLGWMADTDSYLAGRFRRAGLVFCGKTNTPEFGLQPTTEPVAYGPTGNPWDPNRTPGGSSGGSAAAVAAGFVPAAHANDGGGSIRIPASACGLVGLKPSRGRTSLGPDNDASSILVAEHVVTRTVRDAANLLDVTAGNMPGDLFGARPPDRPYGAEVGADPGRLRVGLLTEAPGKTAPVDAECVAAATGTARMLEDLGHLVEATSPEALGRPEWAVNFITVWAVGAAMSVEKWNARLGRRLTAADVETLTWALVEMGTSVSAVRLLSAQSWLQQASRDLVTWWTPDASGGMAFDLLVTPTLAEPPPMLGSFSSPPDNPLAGLFRAGAFCPFTPPFNVSGQPAISLPLHQSAAGLPVGVQLVAAPGREDVLIRVAAQLEAAMPWSGRRPPVD